MSKFILPTLFSAFIGVWYYVFMAELLVLEDVPLHVFSTMARVFYGSLVSFPYDEVLTVILTRLVVWVMFLVLTIDMVQLVLILNRFNGFVLSDAMAVLFSAIFLLSDLFFMLILYHASTAKQLQIRDDVKPKKKAQRLPSVATTKPLSALFQDTKIKF